MRTSLRALAAAGVVAALALTGCSAGTASDDADDTAATTDDGSWPRTIEHASGETEIPEKPVTIVSTSITLTGSLLAIDAPVTASAATGVSGITDDRGFFSQWSDVADERGVEVLYPNLELDLEAIELAEPDLIIGSSIGADATVEAYEQLSEIAPTIMIDYGTTNWRDIMTQLGEATGHEADAAAALEDFDGWLEEQAAANTPVDGPVTALTYNSGNNAMIFEENSSQAALLQTLGFEYQGAPEELIAQARSDASAVTPENLPAAIADLSGIFVISAEDSGAEALKADPLLANATAVKDDAVHALGMTSFRIDYYSAHQFVEKVAEAFGN